MSELCYLATPYSKFPLGVLQAEFEASSKAAKLMLEGKLIFCPIAHSHAIENLMPSKQEGDWWLKQDFAVLAKCDKLLVYKMPSWDTSYGVTKEIEFAKKNNIPIEYIEYDGAS